MTERSRLYREDNRITVYNNGKLQRAAKRQEQGVAERFDGKVTPASGARWYRKNDVRSERFLFECKGTKSKETITIKRTVLRDLRIEALRTGRVPVLQFQLNGDRYVILSEDDFKELTGD